jgi:hypothetical protein
LIFTLSVKGLFRYSRQIAVGTGVLRGCVAAVAVFVAAVRNKLRLPTAQRFRSTHLPRGDSGGQTPTVQFGLLL